MSDLVTEAPDEAQLKRLQPPKSATTDADRPAYRHGAEWVLTKPPNPDWKVGGGASTETCRNRKFVTIDPHEEGRPVRSNYKLMISTTVPRPIALVSSVSADGQTRNLAPFSYFQCVTTDPPTYSLSCSGRQAKDTLRNIMATKELCISMTSDWLVEAANMASIEAPPDVSEWAISGLTPVAGEVVQAPYVAESPFSAECRLLHHQDLFSVADPSVRTSTLLIVQVVRFHVWADALDADRATADLKTLRPVFRAGGVTYGACFDGFEIPRPDPFGADPDVDAVVQKAPGVRA